MVMGQFVTVVPGELQCGGLHGLMEPYLDLVGWYDIASEAADFPATAGCICVKLAVTVTQWDRPAWEGTSDNQP